MIDPIRIQGAGGSSKGDGGSSSTPIEGDDTLQSEQFANVLDLLCEGEIQGLDDGARSIFLDDTPIQNTNGSFNFKNFAIVSQSRSWCAGTLIVTLARSTSVSVIRRVIGVPFSTFTPTPCSDSILPAPAGAGIYDWP